MDLCQINVTYVICAVIVLYLASSPVQTFNPDSLSRLNNANAWHLKVSNASIRVDSYLLDAIDCADRAAPRQDGQKKQTEQYGSCET